MADPPETYNYDSGAGRRKTKPHVSDASDAAMRMRAVLQRAQHQVESTEAVPQGRGYPYDRPQQQPAAPVEKPSTSGSVLGEAQAQAKEVLQGLKSHSAQQEVAARKKAEERMLRDMFKAVWPDLGSFRSWTQATKVASMSGSLSLSLAFFAGVWYMSSQYDRAKEERPTNRVAAPAGAGSQVNER